MSFLSLWSAIIAGAIALPLLVLLYFLKLRRVPLRIASTLLWRKSFEDLQVNAPFQRPRWSLLLLLQLLLLLALLAALAQPVLRGQARAATRVVLVIDHSASMNATIPGDPVQLRLDAAKSAARETVDRLSRSADSPQIMVLAFGANARVVSGFDTNRSALLAAIDSIAPTDEPADLDAALQLAGAYAGRGDETDLEPPDVLVFSDGCVEPPPSAGGFALRAGRFRFIQVVPQSNVDTNNLGIVSFSARRDEDDASEVLVFGRLINAGPLPIETVVTLSADDQPITLIRRTIPGATDAGPGEEGVSATLSLDGGAALKLAHGHRDQLAVDNEALLVMPAPNKPRIVLAYPNGESPDPFLRSMLEELEPQSLVTLSLAAFEALDAQRIDSGAVYDLIVFDRVAPPRLPGVPTLTIGATVPGVKTIQPTVEAGAGRMIMSWDRQSPLMRHVWLDTILYANFGAFELPAGATPLAFGPDGPVIAVLRSRGARHVVVGFKLIDSNWALHVSSAVFLQNVVEQLTMSGSGALGIVHQPGEPITVRAGPASSEIALSGPMSITLATRPGAAVTLPALSLAGLYLASGAAAPNDRLALSVLSDTVSDIRPRPSITVNAETQAAATVGTASTLELWPWLAAAAMALVVVEWLLWCRRTVG